MVGERDLPHEEGAEHRDVAVREVDDPHDAEHERQAASEQCVEATEQEALNDGVDPTHIDSAGGEPSDCPAGGVRRPKYASVMSSRLTDAVADSSAILPSRRQITRSATDIAGRRSFSTSTTVEPDWMSDDSDSYTASTAIGARPSDTSSTIR